MAEKSIHIVDLKTADSVTGEEYLVLQDASGITYTRVTDTEAPSFEAGKYFQAQSDGSYKALETCPDNWQTMYNQCYTRTVPDTQKVPVKLITGKAGAEMKTAAEWESENPILAEGQIGVESDTNKLKIGDGSTAWNSLLYKPGTSTVDGGEIFNSYEDDEENGIYKNSAGEYAHAEGQSTKALGPASHAEGNQTVTGACGYQVTGKDTLAHKYTLTSVKGLSTSDVLALIQVVKANGAFRSLDYINAESIDADNLTITVSDADYKTWPGPFIGYIINISSPISYDKNTSTQLKIGRGAHAEGDASYAIGNYSHAENVSSAVGIASHSEGSSTTAMGEASHSEGTNTFAIGNNSHVEGSGSYTDSINAHAEGNVTQAGASGYQITEITESDNSSIITLEDADEAITVDSYCAIKLGAFNYYHVKITGADIKKNILPYPYTETTKTVSGITFTDNGDGTITANGTATANTHFSLCSDLTLKAGTPYTMSGCPAGGSETTYFMSLDSLDEPVTHTDTGAGVTVTLSADTSKSVGIFIALDTTVNNVVFRPKIVGGTNEVTVDAEILPILDSGVSTDVEPTNYLILEDSIDSHFMSTGPDSHAEGRYSKAYAIASHAEGKSTKAMGDNSHAEGEETLAGNDAHAEGALSMALGWASHAEGNNTEAQGEESHAEGNQTKAIGSSSHAEGERSEAQGDNSHAEGATTKAIGHYSHSEGSMTTANGDYSHAEGSGAFALGNAAHAEGNGKAIGTASHAESSGYAYGGYSHAEGGGIARGQNSHAEGTGTATGEYSHAEGYSATASGNYSHAEGRNVIASGDNQHVQGKYNKEDAEGRYAHIIGMGKNIKTRSNGHTVDWSGNAWYKGDIRVGGTSYDDAYELAIKIKAIPHTTVSGTVSVSITDFLNSEAVINYKIYGNSVQNGTPSAENPVEIQSVGDLITDESSEYYGKYKIVLSGCDQEIPIYLNAPLRQKGSVCDYIDFESQQVVRNIEVVDDTGTKTIDESFSVLSTPTSETLTLGSLTILSGSAQVTISISSTVAPSEFDLTYFQDINKVIAELKSALTQG